MIHLLGSIWTSVTEVEETRIVILGRSGHGKTALFERFKILLNDPSTSATQQRKNAAEAASHSDSQPAAEAEDSLSSLGALKAHIEKQKLLEKEAQDTTVEVQSHRAHRESEDEQKFRFSAALPRFMTPTVGLNVGRGICSVAGDGGTLKINALLWDVGGDPSMRALWQTYLVQAHGVVFVIDLSATPKEISDSVKLLHLLMLRPELAYAPFLVVGTKLDVVKKVQEIRYPLPTRPEEVAVSAVSEQEKKFLQAMDLELLRTLRLEEVALRAIATAQRHHEQHQKRKDAEKKLHPEQHHHDKSAIAAAAAGGGSDDDDFDEVDDNLLIAMEAMDAVHSVPLGSGVSGIAGHMYKAVVGSAETIDGNDLLDSLQWILSVSAMGKARLTAMSALEAAEVK